MSRSQQASASSAHSTLHQTPSPSAAHARSLVSISQPQPRQSSACCTAVHNLLTTRAACHRVTCICCILSAWCAMSQGVQAHRGECEPQKVWLVESARKQEKGQQRSCTCSSRDSSATSPMMVQPLPPNQDHRDAFCHLARHDALLVQAACAWHNLLRLQGWICGYLDQGSLALVAYHMWMSTLTM